MTSNKFAPLLLCGSAILAVAADGTTSAHADTTSTQTARAATISSNNSQKSFSITSSASSATSQSNGSATSQAATTKVSVDSSTLDNAVKGAQSAGLKVTTQPATSQTVLPDEVSSAKQKIENDYSSQAAKINYATASYKHDQSNYNSYNNYKGDTSSLDSVVKGASSTKGLTVTKDADKAINVASNDDNAINQDKQKIQSEYVTEVNNIKNAIATQKQDNSQAAQISDSAKNAGLGIKIVNDPKATEASFQQGINDAKQIINREQSQSVAGSVSSNDVIQNLHIGGEPNDTVTFSNVSSNVKVDQTDVSATNSNNNWTGASGSNHYSKTGYKIDLPSGNPNQLAAGTIVSGTVTFSNLQNTYYGSDDNRTKISKIEEDFVWTRNSENSTKLEPYVMEFNSSPNEGFWYSNAGNVQITYKFFDENGKQIAFHNNAWITVSSLNSATTTDQPGMYKIGDTVKGGYNSDGRVEGVQAANNIQLKNLKGSSVTVGSDGWAKSTGGNDSIYPGYGANTGKYAFDYNGSIWQATPSANGWVIGDRITDSNSDDVWNAGYAYWDGANGSNGDTQYFGATVGEIKNGANSFTLNFATNGNIGGNVTWAMVSTEIPTTPSITINEPVQQIHYHYDVMNVTPPKETLKLVAQYHNLLQTNTPKPIKTDENEQGININGKNILPGDVNKYDVTADYSEYKGVSADDGEIANGFYIIDDYPEEALNADTKSFTAHDSNGKAVTGLTYNIYQSVSAAPKDVQDAITKSGIKINGAFVVAKATNPQQYFKDYVETGKKVTIDMPMTVKDAYSGTYKNQAYQFDFGHGEATDVVQNTVPKISPQKDVVVSVSNQQSLNNSSVELNQIFDYKLAGATIPANEGDPITEYGFYDDYDQGHDQYNGQYKVLLNDDVTLKDGTVLKKGTDVTKNTTQSIDAQKGAVKIEFNKDFLTKIDTDKSGFGATAYLSMKRIKAGDVTNKYTNMINGKPYVSNTVKTHTPKPTTPAPQSKSTPTLQVKQAAEPTSTPFSPVSTTAPSNPSPALQAPVSPSPSPAVLPQTGDAATSKSTDLLGISLLALSMTALGIQLARKPQS